MIEICPVACGDALIQLHQSLGAMILSTALHGAACDEATRSSLTLLLDKQTKLSNTKSRCSSCGPRRPSREVARVSLFEAGSTPQVESISHDWRNELVREMSRDVGCRYETVVRIIGEVCRDLELRCENVERPLREEQSKAQDLRSRLETSQTKVAELEKEAQGRTIELESLMNERGELLNQVATHKDCLNDLRDSLETIRQEFDQAKADAEYAAQTASENARHQDLVYLAILTGKDEILEEQAIKITTSETHTKDLEWELDQLKAQVASQSQTINGQIKLIEELQSTIATTQDLAASKQAELDCLIESEKSLVSSRNEVAAKAQEESTRQNSVLSALRVELQAAKERISDLQHEHMIETSAKDAEVRRLEETLCTSNDKWKTEVEGAVNKAALADKQHASTIANLQSKIKRLRKEREERDKEFAEAQDLSSRLMAVMGMKRSEEICASTDSTEPKHGDGGSPPSRPSSSDPQVLDVHPDRSFDSGTLSKSGPTPKRAKRLRSSQFTNTKPVITSARSTARRSRAPLLDSRSTQNQGFMTPMQPLAHFGTTIKEEAGNTLQENARLDSDDEFFHGADLFTSTDQQQLSVLRSKLSPSTFDETTTEF